MDHETLGGRIPKGERRVRFADSMGMELVSIFLTDLFVLASHTPYTNYNEHRKPPSSRLSSTLQAFHDHHQHHHHNHHHSFSGTTTTGSSSSATTISTTATATATTANATTTNNNINNNLNNYNNNNNSSISNKNSIISKSIYGSKCSNGTSEHYSSYNNHHSNIHHAKVTSNKHPQSPSSFKSSCGSLAAAASSPTSPPAEFICEFTQPVSLISFKERVKLKKVHLESCYINTTAGHVSLTCNIRVLNVSYDKSVSVRYTTDDWASHTDSLASFKPGSCDGWSDQFTSTISIINKLQPGQRMIFAVRFASAGVVYWDNNGGLNYSVKNKCAGSN